MQEKISEIDENSYQRIIQEDLKFAQEDIEKINQLLQVELDEEFLKKRTIFILPELCCKIYVAPARLENYL